MIDPCIGHPRDAFACVDCIAQAIEDAVKAEREACEAAAMLRVCMGLCLHGECGGKRSAAAAIRARGAGEERVR